MLKILSSLTLLKRIDVTADAWVLASGVTGKWVSISSGSSAKPSAGAWAFPVWNESNRDGSVGFTPDVAATGKVSVIYGKLHGVTDQFTGTPAAGDALKVTADGVLATVTPGTSENVVAICLKPAATEVYLGTSYSVIEFVTI